MELLDIRVGHTQAPEVYQELLIDKKGWPEKESVSSYSKHSVESVEVTLEGLEGNEIGHPHHLINEKYRSALVQNELVWAKFEEVFPGSSESMFRGCFGENFVVNHPDLMPSVVCVGDIYQIGTATFRVTGPRTPCPKVDAWLNLSGIATLGKKTGWTGYFLQVVQPGKCTKGDRISLLERPRPEYTIERLSRGLWGNADELEDTVEFYRSLCNMEELIPRHYRDTAQLRLQRLLDKNEE